MQNITLHRAFTCGIQAQGHPNSALSVGARCFVKPRPTQLTATHADAIARCPKQILVSPHPPAKPYATVGQAECCDCACPTAVLPS